MKKKSFCIVYTEKKVVHNQISRDEKWIFYYFSFVPHSYISFGPLVCLTKQSRLIHSCIVFSQCINTRSLFHHFTAQGFFDFFYYEPVDLDLKSGSHNEMYE